MGEPADDRLQFRRRKRCAAFAADVFDFVTKNSIPDAGALSDKMLAEKVLFLVRGQRIELFDTGDTLVARAFSLAEIKMRGKRRPDRRLRRKCLCEEPRHAL